MSHNGLGKTLSIDAEDGDPLPYMPICRNTDSRIRIADRNLGEILLHADVVNMGRDLRLVIQAEIVIALVLHNDKAARSHCLLVLVIHQPLSCFRIKTHVLEAFFLQQFADWRNDGGLHAFPRGDDEVGCDQLFLGIEVEHRQRELEVVGQEHLNALLRLLAHRGVHLPIALGEELVSCGLFRCHRLRLACAPGNVDRRNRRVHKVGNLHMERDLVKDIVLVEGIQGTSLRTRNAHFHVRLSGCDRLERVSPRCHDILIVGLVFYDNTFFRRYIIRQFPTILLDEHPVVGILRHCDIVCHQDAIVGNRA